MNGSDSAKELIELLKRKQLSNIFNRLSIEKGLSINDIKIPNKTDILLESIILEKNVFVNKVLNMGFNLENSEILYLHHAVRSNNEIIVGFLLNYIKKTLPNNGVDYLNKQEAINKNNVLHEAINYKVNSKILLRLSEENVSWNTLNKLNISPLYELFFHPEYLNSVLDKSLIDSIISKKADFEIKQNNNLSVKDLILTINEYPEWKENKNFQYLLKLI